MLNEGDARGVADRFGLGDGAMLSGPVARGELGQVWRLATATGVWAVKESFEPVDHANARDDAAFQDAVRSAGVALPAVVRTPDGEVVAGVGRGQVRVYAWVDLAAPDRGIDPVEVGQLVAAIHRVGRTGRGPVDPWYTDPVGPASWDELIRRLGAAGSEFADQLAALRGELVALEGLLEPPTHVQTCHRDLFANNLRATQAGSLCVIDWENSGPADPRQELAVVLSEFAWDDADRARLLYGAYRDAGGPARITQPGDFSMLIAQLGHIGAHACRRWLHATQPDDHDHHAARIVEFLSDPPTRDGIAYLLDAIGGGHAGAGHDAVDGPDRRRQFP